MKKLVSIFLSTVIICSLFSISGCGKTEKVQNSDGKISIVTTIFPYYDFVRQLAGDKADVRLLLSPEVIHTAMNPHRPILLQLKIAIFLFITVAKVTNGLTECFHQLKTKMSK